VRREQQASLGMDTGELIGSFHVRIYIFPEYVVTERSHLQIVIWFQDVPIFNHAELHKKTCLSDNESRWVIKGDNILRLIV